MAVILHTRRRQRERLGWRLAGIICAAVLMAGGCIWGARLIIHRGAPAENEPKISLSSVQTQLEELDWVTEDLLPLNDYSRPGTKLTEVNAIVIHYVGNPGTTAEQNRSYYENLAETYETSASSNFLVGMDGGILACVPVDEVAYCSNSRNSDTISVECCHPDKTGKFTPETYASLVRLTAWLCNRLGLDASAVIRHYDVTKKECPKYFVDHEDAWKAFRQDVQEALNDLQSAPESPST